MEKESGATATGERNGDTTGIKVLVNGEWVWLDNIKTK
jgi:hypothetical protein